MDMRGVMAWTGAVMQGLASKLMGIGYARRLADRMSWREVRVRKSVERCHALHRRHDSGPLGCSTQGLTDFVSCN